MSACMYVSVCFEHENTRSLDNHSVMTKIVGVGHELCQLAVLQIHAIEPQLGSHCCSVIFLSLFFPHCFSHSCYSITCPFTPSPEKYPCIFHKQMTLEHTLQWLKLSRPNFLILTWLLGRCSLLSLSFCWLLLFFLSPFK